MLKEDMVITIANILATNNIETSAIITSLKILCKSLCFDGAVVYEMDHDNSLYLKEHVVIVDTPIQQNFMLEEIEDKYYNDLSENRITYVTKKTISVHAELLTNYDVSSLLIIS